MHKKKVKHLSKSNYILSCHKIKYQSLISHETNNCISAYTLSKSKNVLDTEYKKKNKLSSIDILLPKMSTSNSWQKKKKKKNLNASLLRWRVFHDKSLQLKNWGTVYSYWEQQVTCASRWSSRFCFESYSSSCSAEWLMHTATIMVLLPNVTNKSASRKVSARIEIAPELGEAGERHCTRAVDEHRRRVPLLRWVSHSYGLRLHLWRAANLGNLISEGVGHPLAIRKLAHCIWTPRLLLCCF